MTAKERYVAYLAKKAPRADKKAPRADKKAPRANADDEARGSSDKLTLVDYRRFLLRLLSLHPKGCDCIHCTEIKGFLPKRRNIDVPNGYLSLADASRLFGYSTQALTNAVRENRLAVSKYSVYKIVAVEEMERYVVEMNKNKRDRLKTNRFKRLTSTEAVLE